MVLTKMPERKPQVKRLNNLYQQTNKYENFCGTTTVFVFVRRLV